jgi:hypothetical protein
VRPERFELPTCCSGGNRSIQLSYGRARVLTVYMWRGTIFNVEITRLARFRPSIRCPLVAVAPATAAAPATTISAVAATTAAASAASALGLGPCFIDVDGASAHG